MKENFDSELLNKNNNNGWEKWPISEVAVVAAAVRIRELQVVGQDLRHRGHRRRRRSL